MTSKVGSDDRLELASWRFKLGRLGCLDSDAGEMEFKPFTVVCGPNNTGKTWAMYALYGFLDEPGFVRLPELGRITTDLEKEGQLVWDFGQWLREHAKRIIAVINQATKRKLASIFNSDTELFKESKFDWEVDPEVLIERGIARAMNFRLAIGRDKNEILRVLKPARDGHVKITLLSEKTPDAEYILGKFIVSHLIGNPPGRNVFLMPAERNGLHLFYRELASRRTTLLHHAAKKDFDIGQLIKDVVGSRYAQPIADYIDWLNDLPNIRKKKGGPFHEMAEEIKSLVGGRYEIDAEGDITFTPYKLKRGDKNAPRQMDLHLTSSTVKSLFGLWAYLEFDARPGDVLMVDEPELNLHPSNQRKLARLLARLVNSDLRVVISTHSDYLVREMNSLIMLSQQHPARLDLMKELGYIERDTLLPSSVAAWLFCDRKVKPMDITKEEGIAADTFDEQINQLNDAGDRIYYAFQDGNAVEGGE